MDTGFYIFLFIAGFLTGIASGLLGIGGGLIIIPTLKYVPELIGLKSLNFHLITGISSMQTVFGTTAASFFHRKTGNVNYFLVINIGIGIAVGALLGSIGSKYISEEILLIVYGFFIAVPAVLLLTKKEPAELTENNSKINNSRWKFILIGFLVGVPSGSLGFAGSVVIVPLLNTVFEVPIKICISSGTHIAFITSIMSFIGKLGTGQIELVSGVIISISSVTGAFIGTGLNKKAPTWLLKYILLGFIIITLFRVVIDIFKL